MGSEKSCGVTGAGEGIVWAVGVDDKDPKQRRLEAARKLKRLPDHE
jgi:hypothetical protein